MLITNEDYTQLTTAIRILQTICRNAVMSELEEEHELRLQKLLKDNITGGAFEKIYKEINKMPLKFREIFNEEWLNKHLRQKPNGVYEIRCTINKVAISSSSKSLNSAAEDFIRKLVNLERGTKKKIVEEKTLFCDFTEKWFTVVKKPTVKPNTYESFYSTYTTHIKPYFRNKTIQQITPLEIQPLFNKFIRAQKSRTAQIVKVLLNQIFKAAVAERKINSNPMDGVQILKHSTKKGKALTLAEEYRFLQDIKGSSYELAFVLLLFGGMRRGELRTLKIENGFLLIKDGKLRIGLEQTIRRVPITPMLAPYLQKATATQIKEAVNCNVEMLTRHFKSFCSAHHLHELRHTFISRCQECGVPREVVSVWAGHAADKTMTSTVYTHFADDFMISEGKKVDYYNRLEA